MRYFVSDYLGVGLDQADILRAEYWRTHGTTLAGMMDMHGMPPKAFLHYVHDINFSVLSESPRLAKLIKSLPGRKIVYTNGTEPYAREVLRARGLNMQTIAPNPKPEHSIRFLRSQKFHQQRLRCLKTNLAILRYQPT